MSKMISAEQAAKILGLTRQQVYNLIGKDLTELRIGNTYALDMDEVLELARRRVVEAEHEWRTRKDALRDAQEKLEDDRISAPAPVALAAA